MEGILDVTFVTVQEQQRSDICKNYQYEHFQQFIWNGCKNRRFEINGTKWCHDY
jgi:hypothetical protein